MNIITTAAASIALIGFLSLGISNFDDQSNNSQIKQTSNDKKTQIITSDELQTTPDNDIALR
jgi:hypothetical protein